MYQKMIEEEDTIYELDEECINKKKEERENRVIQSWEQQQKKNK